ncbi:Polyadenylate-binding protein like [Actinidia chinensis var. chinensis]|uniref:Polyadenylate-binding protein like n=1 Tax=Actinidia chinensis var. chinensis TaxID=1590841 RepID=A0A2R6R922_ACTCC|nr:Polyadenylate-binding protein like [Actinidia chinensis var. chinensis]
MKLCRVIVLIWDFLRFQSWVLLLFDLGLKICLRLQVPLLGFYVWSIFVPKRGSISDFVFFGYVSLGSRVLGLFHCGPMGFSIFDKLGSPVSGHGGIVEVVHGGALVAVLNGPAAHLWVSNQCLVFFTNGLVIIAMVYQN